MHTLLCIVYMYKSIDVVINFSLVQKSLAAIFFTGPISDVPIAKNLSNDIP